MGCNFEPGYFFRLSTMSSELRLSAMLLNSVGRVPFLNLIEAQRIFNRELPVVPLFQRVMISAYNASVSGIKLNATNVVDTWNVESWDISE